MAVVEVPFDLVATKLEPPSIRPGTVAKPAVIGRLQASGGRVVTIIAPAGYGKTTFLARWAVMDARPFAWVALDDRDDDPAVFFRYIAAAIHGVRPLPTSVFDALTGLAASDWTTRIPRIGGALFASERPLVLVVEDLHLVENPACLDALAALLEYIPAGSQLAISSRALPELPLARWRAQGWLEEIGVPDLRLDAVEADALLRAAGLELNSAELAELAERTEGWPAGLYLAALSLRAGGSGPASANSFAGDDRFVAEYFRLEALSRLPEEEADFLKQTSVLDRMCGSLCDAVLGTTGSASRLESLERLNCFVVPLDRRGEWYRYHHLFGQLLRTELERSEPEAVPALNSRAMAWCMQNDLPDAAVVHGHAAGQDDTVASLIDRLALPFYYDGRMETVDEWLAWFDDGDLVRYPALAVYAAWFRAIAGQPDEAARLLELADGAVSTVPLSDGSDSIKPWVANLRAFMMPKGVERALADADLALERFHPESGWRPSAHAIRGIVHALLGDGDLAETDLRAAVRIGQAIGAIDDVDVANAQLALLAATRGAWAEAARHAGDTQAAMEETRIGNYPVSAFAYVAVARVALHEGREADARSALARAHRIRPLLDHGFPWLTISVGLELTRAHLALGEPEAARTVLTETERVLDIRPDVGSLVADARELRERVSATSGSEGVWAMSLTGAELRLLPYLATHLTFPEIASRLFITRNTVKTEAISIYRKFGASSRSEAIERAIEVGLLESSIYPRT